MLSRNDVSLGMRVVNDSGTGNELMLSCVDDTRNRVIFMGDVHGMNESLQ